MSVDLQALFGKLNQQTRGVVENAAGLCQSRTHYDVEIEHYIMKLLDAPDTDAATIFKHYGIDRARLSADTTAALDRLRSGNGRMPALSPLLIKMLVQAWTIGSMELGASEIRTGHTLLALTANDDLRRVSLDISRELGKLSAERLRGDFATLVAKSPETTTTAALPEAPGRAHGGQTPNLDQYTIDLTARAREGKIDPVVGRDFEVRQLVDILTRRRQNNPILVGEAGVGKTAIVEGFAIRIAEQDVPPALQNVTLRTLDLALLQAGAGVKGEFENRLKGLIAEIKSSPSPIVLFIDEAHTMIGAGGQAGQNDAANLLKPALARGELRTIAATTWSEYKKYFEKDPALTRRFQLVKVEEPSEEKTLTMLRSIVPTLEAHHNVRILDDGIDAAVRLSHRYLPDRQLPDKAVSVLDTACARLALGQNTTPADLEGLRRTLDDLVVQDRVLAREEAVGSDHSTRRTEIASRRVAAERQLEELQARWNEERGLVTRLREVRERLERNVSGQEPIPESEVTALRSEIGTLDGQLSALQGERPLVRVCVDAGVVSEVISGWTGIPVGKMLRDDLVMALSLEEHLGRRIIGQDHALAAICRRIRSSRAGIDDPGKPKGVFLLVGPSGVGKTETALALSDLLYGGEHNLITINMSEFQEAHTVSTLKGSPPGYVGYGEGGVLTEAVRRRPYSVVLLDELEKAHPDVLELFYQVFDKGVMEDGEGRQVDFKNAIIVLTTNAASATIAKLCADPETTPETEGLVKVIKPELDTVFKPAFLGRTVIVPYMPIADNALKRIIVLKLGKIQRRVQETHRVTLICDDTVIDAIAARCTEVESGARNVDNILTNTLVPDVSRLLLNALAEGRGASPTSIKVVVGSDGRFEYEPQSGAGESAVPVESPQSALAV